MPGLLRRPQGQPPQEEENDAAPGSAPGAPPAPAGADAAVDEESVIPHQFDTYEDEQKLWMEQYGDDYCEDDRSTSTMGVSASSSFNVDRDGPLEKSQTSTETTQTSNQKKAGGGLLGPRFRERKEQEAAAAAQAAVPNATTDEPVTFKDLLRQKREAAAAAAAANATTDETTKQANASPTENDEYGKQQPASNSNPNGPNNGLFAAAKFGGQSNEYRGFSKRDDDSYYAGAGGVHDEEKSTETSTEDRLGDGQREVEQRASMTEAGMPRSGEESNENEDSDATAMSGWEPQGAWTTENRHGAGATFGTVSSDNERILPAPSLPDAFQLQRTTGTSPATVQGGSGQAQNSGGVLRKTGNAGPGNQGRSLLRRGSFAPRPLQAAQTRGNKSVSVVQNNPNNTNQSFRGSLDRSRTTSTNAKAANHLSALPRATSTSTGSESTSFSPEREIGFAQANKTNGFALPSATSTSKGKTALPSPEHESEFAHTGLGQANHTNGGAGILMRMEPEKNAFGRQPANKGNDLSPYVPTDEIQESQLIAAPAMQTATSVAKSASAVHRPLLPGQKTPKNGDNAGTILKTPQPRGTHPDFSLDEEMETSQNVAAATITPGPRTALKERARLGTDHTQDPALLQAMNQYASNENKSSDNSNNNERIIPAGNANNEKKFEENHEEFQRIIRDLTDLHESSDKSILDLNVRLATAYAETLQDQGDLSTFLGSLVQLSASMDAMIGEYEELVDVDECAME